MINGEDLMDKKKLMIILDDMNELIADALREAHGEDDYDEFYADEIINITELIKEL